MLRLYPNRARFDIELIAELAFGGMKPIALLKTKDGWVAVSTVEQAMGREAEEVIWIRVPSPHLVKTVEACLGEKPRWDRVHNLDMLIDDYKRMKHAERQAELSKRGVPGNC